MKKFILTVQYVRLLFIGLIICSLAACKDPGHTTSLASILKRDVVRVGTLQGPANYYRQASNEAGFEFELARKYSQYLGVELDMVVADSLSELLQKLDSGQVDILAAGLSVTEQRLENYRFAPSYTEVSQELVFKQGGKWPKSINEIDGKLMVVQDSSHAQSLEQLQKLEPQLSWQETDSHDSEELLNAVADGDIDFTIVDSNTLALNQPLYPQINVAFTIEKSQPIAWMLARDADDALLASLVEFFGTSHHDGTLLTLQEKYFTDVTRIVALDNNGFISAAKVKLPQFESLFRRHAEGMDWRLLAAIAYQESQWQPTARSHTGGRGIMMLDKKTARQLDVHSRLDAAQSIRGSAKLFQQMFARIPQRIDEPDRQWFALAAYNIGWGHLEDARLLTEQQGGDPDRWLDVKASLPLLKQRKYYQQAKFGYVRGDEPVRYVENIRAYYDTLVHLDEQNLHQD
ncbi:membrane-bound lytic murein transglycosylase MltF [Thalassotalea mangrovi]|uniref:Membrane-bound lytic murein transglycosylase F n=1 Tax=Thalassotalea mangrovi TaxID=2572245 RepID=A0A4U1B974_9GAMM|nr:membrane-bound lytic murein transglycosylase MltF [Thalassotalea mangrovi]TKB47115.1 membrane-bound lytic murein transglycosylase MltF [Thalassotalea mangrovi]